MIFTFFHIRKNLCPAFLMQSTLCIFIHLGQLIFGIYFLSAIYYVLLSMQSCYALMLCNNAMHSCCEIMLCSRAMQSCCAIMLCSHAHIFVDIFCKCIKCHLKSFHISVNDLRLLCKFVLV